MNRITQAIVVDMKDQVGGLDELLKVASDSNVSLDYIYTSFHRKDLRPVVILQTEDGAVTECILKNNGFNVFTSAGVYEQEWDDKARNSDIYFLKVGGYTDYRWVAQSNNFVDSRIGESEIFANGSLTFKITSPVDFILNYKDDESLDGTAYINSLLDKVFKEYISKIENTEIENISKEDMKEYMIKTLNEENNGIQISDLNVDEIYASLSTNSKLADNSLNKIESTASSSSGKRVYAQNYFYVKEEGGLDKVVSVNYKYKMVINDKTYNVRIFSLESTTQVFPGDNSMVVFEAEENIERNDGDRYELYLGDKKVGKGLVSD